MRLVLACATLLVVVAGWPAGAAAQAPDPIMIVVDTSGSMADPDEGNRRAKIDGAKLALLDFIAEVEPGTPVGLRQYPAPDSSSCNTGSELAEAAPLDVTALSRSIRGLRADGDTPTAEALRAAAARLQASSADGRGTLVLVSDGESTCGNPCKAAREIAAAGVDLQTITVGFRISDSGRNELECVADEFDGEYVDANSGEDLSDAVRDASSPALTVEVAEPVLTTAPDNPVEIQATIANGARIDARDTIARLRLRGVADEPGSGSFLNPGVQQPTRRLGNVGPAVPSHTVTWTFRPGAALLEGAPGGRRTLEFYVVASAANTRVPVERKVTVEVVDPTSAADAGPILKDRTVAIMGDSYSAGEGAEDYLQGTATSRNKCHRSPSTYLKEVFSVPDDHLLACSGGVIADFDAPDGDNDVPAQREQLRDVMNDGIDAAVLTVSGNDIGFGDLAVSCLIYKPCNEQVVTDVRGVAVSLLNTPAEAFISDVVGNDEYVVRLTEVLRGLHGNLNNESSFQQRGAAAPILVLAYPIVVPLTGRSCGPMFRLLSPAEIDFIVRVVAELNAQVEEAVLTARRDYGVPAHFVPTTETAFLPEHTVCDGEPYARALNSFDGEIPDDLAATLPEDFGVPVRGSVKRKVVRGGAGVGLGIARRILAQGKQELVHPNKSGYQALTRAILRWSTTPEAVVAAQDLEKVEPVPLLPTWTVSTATPLDAGDVQGSPPTLQGGTAYPLSGTGFAPGTALTITIQSTPQVLAEALALDDGTYETIVGIPRTIDAGAHEIVISGAGPDGRPREQRLPVEVDQAFSLSVPTALGLGALAALALALASYAASRLAAPRRAGAAPIT